MMTNHNQIRFVNADDVSSVLGISQKRLTQILADAPNDAPPHIRLGTDVRFLMGGPHGLEAWAARRATGGAL